jgi:phosphatidylethanolamine/phosphatidyl-N-methylethanolamine N-methyltransferase
MVSLPQNVVNKSIATGEKRLFFKQWLKSPMQLGTFAPLSMKLAHLAANQVNADNRTTIVEIGAGTGRLTRALLAKGVNIDRFAMVELDHKMCGFLDHSLKQMYQSKKHPPVIHGNAENLVNIIPRTWVGKVDYVVSAIPLMYMEETLRERIIQASLDVLNPVSGSIIHVTYSPVSPIRFMEGEIIQKRVVSLWGNIPPGFVWRFTPKRYLHDLS